MKNKIILLVLFSLIINIRLSAINEDSVIIAKAVSMEVPIDTINELVYIHFTLEFHDTMKSAFRAKLQKQNFSQSVPWDTSTDYYFEFNDSVIYPYDTIPTGTILEDSIALYYNKSNLPYYYQAINLKFHTDSILTELLEPIYLYFTPYNTIEIWNKHDFDLLPRSWDSELATSPQRIYIPFDSIPVTDISNDSLSSDTILRSYYSVPGLGYSIPIYYIDDTTGSNNSGPVQSRADGCGLGLKRWRGSFTGNVKGAQFPDFRANSEIVITGIKIELWELDPFPGIDRNIGETYTDDDGNFTINVNTCQAAEGDNLELYIRVRSVTANEKISVENYFGMIKDATIMASSPLEWAYNDGELDDQVNFNQIWPARDACRPQLLHWGNQCFNFTTNALGAEITNEFTKVAFRQPIFSGAHFLPVLGNKIFIRLDNDGRGYDENTAYHEFGHYLMWNLQDRAWTNIFEAGLARHSFAGNIHPKLAWTEGWASGFQAIMDIHSYDYDNESGLERRNNSQNENENDYTNYETRRLWANLTQLPLFGQGVRPQIVPWDTKFGPGDFRRVRTLTHGLCSEFHVSTALLDLYDGTSKVSRMQMNVLGTISEQALFNENVANDGEDINGERINDLISLTFAKICQPLLNKQGNGLNSSNVIQNISEYSLELGKVVSCEERRFILDIFQLNEISNLDEDFILQDMVSTDEIGTNREIEISIFEPRSPLNDRYDFKFTGNVSEIFFTNVDQIDETTGSFNLGTINANESKFISDVLVVQDGESLFLNSNRRIRFMTNDDPFIANNSHLDVHICNTRTTVSDGAGFELGSEDGSETATASLSPHSVFQLGGNNSIGNLIINDNSKFIIEDSAVLELHPNSQIVLNGDNAILEINGTIRLMNGATFNVVGGNLGFGYIRVNKNYVPQTPVFQSDNNQLCGINIVGDGASDKILEIKGTDGLYIGLNAIVNISNCKIEIETPSKLNTEVLTLAMTNVDIVPLNNVNGHRGVMIPGYTKTDISGVNIYGGSCGLTFYKRGMNRAFKIYDVDIIDCLVGIRSEGVDFELDLGYIHDYTYYGISASGMSGRTTIYNTDITLSSQSTSSKGILHTGSGSLFCYKTLVNKNGTGVETWDGNITLGCCTISNSTDIGLRGEVTSILSTNAGSGGGYNLFTDNDNHLLSRYHGQWIPYGGSNVMIGPNSTVKFWGSLGLNIPYVNYSNGSFDAVDNYFDGGSASPWAVSTPSLLEAKSIGALDIIRHDHLGNMLGTYLSTINTECGQGPCDPCEQAMPLDTGRYGDFTYTITTGLLGTGDIKEQLFIFSDSLISDSTSFYYGLKGYCQILNNSYVDSPSRQIQGTLRDIYVTKMKNYQNAISNWNDSGNYSIDSITNMMLSCNAGLLAKARNNKQPWKYMMYELFRDRASIFRVTAEYDSVFVCIDSGYANTIDPGKEAQLEYLECFYGRERLLYDSTITPDSLLNMSTCTLQSYAPPIPQILNENMVHTQWDDILRIYPNPVENEFIINGKWDKLSIFNTTGSLVLSYMNNNNSGQNANIDVKDIVPGVYTIVVYGADKVVNKCKIIKL